MLSVLATPENHVESWFSRRLQLLNLHTCAKICHPMNVCYNNYRAGHTVARFSWGCKYMSSVKENLHKVQEKIAPYTTKIIAVTKYYNEDKLLEAYDAGLRDFGENRVNDALAKFAKLPDEVKSNSFFHLIGHLQSNKVKKAVGSFDYIHSVDSLKLAQMIDGRAEELGIVQKIFLQLNNAREEQKSGFSPEQLKEDFGKIIQMNNIKVLGLMNIAPIGLEENELSHLFEGVKNIQNELKSEYACEMDELSMGMSGDYLVAVRFGATYVRLGRVLFN